MLAPEAGSHTVMQTQRWVVHQRTLQMRRAALIHVMGFYIIMPVMGLYIIKPAVADNARCVCKLTCDHQALLQGLV